MSEVRKSKLNALEIECSKEIFILSVLQITTATLSTVYLLRWIQVFSHSQLYPTTTKKNHVFPTKKCLRHSSEPIYYRIAVLINYGDGRFDTIIQLFFKCQHLLPATKQNVPYHFLGRQIFLLPSLRGSVVMTEQFYSRNRVKLIINLSSMYPCRPSGQKIKMTRTWRDNITFRVSMFCALPQ